jgi:UDP-N-acetylglucosamine--N-acetylmuramyl-(pentapeptide) pyrophosphoryl-undecaprenol N-acetylglucosamine transferase
LTVRVLVAGGGTGGHVEPALALADAIRRAMPEAQITALGTSKGLETRLVPARGYPLELIPPVPLPRRPSIDLLRLPARIRKAVRAAGEVIDRTGAQVVVGFGGYVALPAYLAARRRHLPIVVHEANAKPGLANRIAARFTPHVFTASAAVRLPHAQAIGIPLRQAVSGLDRAALRTVARAEFGLDADRPTLLVTGGSQGARTLNNAAIAAAARLAAAGVQVLHLAGPANVDALRDDLAVACDKPGVGDVRVPYVRVPYVVLGHVQQMHLAYAAADFVLARCGAMTVAELAAVGLPAAYVPYPHGNGEQRFNAMPVVDAGGAILVDDAQCTADWLIQTVLPIMTDPVGLAAMSAAASRSGSREADEVLAAIVLELAARPTASTTQSLEEGDHS